MKNIFRNYKTTIPGIAVAAVALLVAFGYINEHQATAISGALVALGLMAAKDNDKTGTSIK
jgi:hypothetical protein